MLLSLRQQERKSICSRFDAPPTLGRWIPRVLGWLNRGWLLFHPGFAGAQTPILSDGFEGAFPLGVTTMNCTATKPMGVSDLWLLHADGKRHQTDTKRRAPSHQRLDSLAGRLHGLASAIHAASDPPIPWSNVTNIPAQVEAQWQVTAAPASRNQFYRLKQLP